MKVLNLSLDKKILDKDSDVAKRAIAYGKKLDKYFIIVPGKNINLDLAANIKVQGIGASNKFQILFKIFQFLDKHLKEQHYDLITVQDVYYLASVAINLASKYRLKTEIQVHGLEKMTFFRRAIAKSNLTQAHLIRTVSQYFKDKIIKEFGIKADKIYISPVAIDKNKMLKERDFSLKEKYPNDFIFLTVGRLVAVKNIAMQIEALAKLGNQQTILVIVGDGPEKDALLSLTKKLKIEDRIVMTGWVDDLADYYRSADCLLLSSDNEGYGMVVAEAVLSGLPVIMTNVGVAGELVENDVSGLIVPTGNQNKFTEAMNRVANDQNLLQKFSTNTVLYKDKILSQEELAENIINNWKKIINVQ